MKRRHYHGNHGQAGCLFDVDENYTFTSKKEASAWIRNEIAEFRELGYTHPRRVTFTLKDIPVSVTLTDPESFARHVIIETWVCYQGACE